MRKTHYKKTGVSRTMWWLKIPKKNQQEFKQNFLNISVDYLQYTCYKISEPLKAIYAMWFSGETDMDNSNVEFHPDYTLSLENKATKMGHAYTLVFMSPWFKPIPIASIEVYNPNRVKTLGTEWKIVFYGAFFVFYDIIKEEAPQVIRFANAIELWTIVWTRNYEQTEHFRTYVTGWKPIKKQITEKPVYKRTRVDIAVDVSVSVNQLWLSKFIEPHKTSNSVPKPYNHRPELWGWQSLNYMPRLGQCIWIRVYNKKLDIEKKHKQSWYPEYMKLDKPVTRIEVVYSWESAQDKIDNLINFTKFRILDDEEVKINRKYRPKSTYSAQSAYVYFSRYSKNHGKELHEVLRDVCKMAIQEQEKEEEYKFLIFENL